MDYAKFKRNQMTRLIRETDNIVYHSVNFNLSGITAKGDLVARDNAAYQCVLVPDNGKFLPFEISVTGTTSTYAFKYDHVNGTVYIPSGEIFGDITITATATTVDTNDEIVLNVEKITAATYDGTTQYSNEKFLMLDIYPARGSTVTVEYGGLTKTVVGDITTDAYESEVAKKVYFGTYLGIADEAETPDSGTLTIRGSCLGYTCGKYDYYDGDKVSERKCSCITEVLSLGSVKTIKRSAFWGCAKLQDLDIGESVELIEGSSFNSTGLTSIVIPSNVKSVNNAAFTCENLANIVIEDGVETLGGGCFMGTPIQEIRIPKSVKTIGADTGDGDATDFGDIYGGFHPFTGCSKLTSIIVDNNNPYFNDDGNCLIEINDSKIITGLANSTVPSYVKKIGDYSFGRISNDEDVSPVQIIFPNGLTEIGLYAFSITGLTDVVIPSSVVSIGEYAFSNCPHLSSATFLSGLDTLSNHIFDGCKKLSNVSLRDGLKSLGEYVFYKCSALTSIDIPSTVTSIGKYTFAYTGITNIDIPVNVTSISDSLFYHCENLTSIIIPDNVTSIEDDAFSYCTSLADITLSSSLTNIGDYSFNNCTSLTNIVIPASVTTIGSRVFNACSSLTNITLECSTPPTLSGDLSIYNTTIITVPAGTGDTYKAATNWSTYASQIVEAT